MGVGRGHSNSPQPKSNTSHHCINPGQTPEHIYHASPSQAGGSHLPGALVHRTSDSGHCPLASGCSQPPNHLGREPLTGVRCSCDDPGQDSWVTQVLKRWAWWEPIDGSKSAATWNSGCLRHTAQEEPGCQILLQTSGSAASHSFTS